MAFNMDTGNGLSFALTTQTAAAALKVKKVTIGETSIDMLDTSHLGTVDIQERIISDLSKPGDYVIDFFFNVAATAINITKLVDTATFTLPVGPGQTTTTGGTLVASGYVTKVKLPDFENGVVQMGQLTFSPDGDTGPTYTKGS